MIYKRSQPSKSRTKHQRTRHELELTVKCILMLVVLPAFPTWFAMLFWKRVFWERAVHLPPELEVIATAAWVPVIGLLYCLFATVVLACVWGEYKEMRRAIKRCDLDTFVDLRDESMSPLMHSLMGAVACALLLSFMSLHYPDYTSGLICVGTTAYLLVLVAFVVDEIDDPCAGIWFIKDIPAEWLAIDVEDHRRKRNGSKNGNGEHNATAA